MMNVEEEYVWRALHSAWIDMFAEQHAETVEAIIGVMGPPTFGNFIGALEIGFLRVIAWRTDDDIPCLRFEVYGPEERWLGMGAVGAEGVGLDSEFIGREFDEGLSESLADLMRGLQ